MSKRVSILVALVIIVAIFVYKNPVQINRELAGSTLSSVTSNANKPVNISIKGELRRNLFSQDDFFGVIIIDGKSINVRTAIPSNLKMRINRIKDKLGGMPIEAMETQVVDGMVKVRGQVMFSREFDLVWGYSDTLREQYNDNELTFAGSMDINDLYHK